MVHTDAKPASTANANSPDADYSRDAAPIELEDGFQWIAFADCRQFLGKSAGSARPTWVEDGPHLFRTTGDPRGYLYTDKSYADFTLRLEYRFINPEQPENEVDSGQSNTGVLVYITGEHRVWPKCLEVQGKYVEIAHIKSNARDVAVEATDDEESRKKARKPVGEWNALEVVSRGGALESRLNDVKICSSQPTELKNGPIGLQSEGFPVQFRNVRIRED